MERTFYRYIARSFWAPFAFGLAAFCLLLIFGSLVDKLNFFMKSGAGAGLFARHILYQTPYFVVKMAPLATLLAVLFALGGMMSHGEWKAGLAGGWQPFQMIKPLLVCAALAGLGQLALQETLAPDLYLKAEYIFEGKLRARGDWRQVVRKDVCFSSGPETFVTARLFDGQRRAMSGVIVSVFRDGRLFTELSAERAAWDQAAGEWRFSGGAEVRYRGEAPPVIERFAERLYGVTVPPEDLVLEKLVPDGLNSLQVLDRLRRLRAVGYPSSAERTLLWVKLAGPFANPVMALIGAAMVLLLRTDNRFFSFGLALGTGFFFWAVIIMAQEAGNSELLPPSAAGFLPILAFLAASLWGLRRARAL